MLPIRRHSLVASTCEEIAKRWLTPSPSKDEDRWLPPERELSRHLGVSRTVLREATQRLESQGLVEIRHGIGIRVTANLHKPVIMSLLHAVPDPIIRARQSLQLRRLLEPEVAAAAASSLRTEELAKLEEIHRLLPEARITEEALGRDLEFHRFIASTLRNDLLLIVLEGAAEISRELRRLAHFAAGASKAYLGHQIILDALVARDPSKARSAMAEHLEHAITDFEARVSTPAPQQSAS